MVREDKLGFGTKLRAVDAVMSQPEYRDHETLVYVGPRVGFAGISLAKWCQDHAKKLILFCPASKQISTHQAIPAVLGAELRFIRVAAMPVLQGYAKAFAAKRGHAYFPLGVSVPAAVAGLYKTALIVHKSFQRISLNKCGALCPRARCLARFNCLPPGQAHRGGSSSKSPRW